MKNKELELAFDTFIESIKNDIEEKEITKEEVLKLKTGTPFIIYNPLTDQYKEELASPIDIVHNKHCYEKLKFYIKGKKND